MAVVKLEALKFERYGLEDFYRVKAEYNDLMEALKKVINYGNFYIDVDTIEEDELSIDDILDNLLECNGDGCDEILYLEINGDRVIGDEEVIL